MNKLARSQGGDRPKFDHDVFAEEFVKPDWKLTDKNAHKIYEHPIYQALYHVVLNCKPDKERNERLDDLMVHIEDRLLSQSQNPFPAEDFKVQIDSDFRKLVARFIQLLEPAFSIICKEQMPSRKIEGLLNFAVSYWRWRCYDDLPANERPDILDLRFFTERFKLEGDDTIYNLS